MRRCSSGSPVLSSISCADALFSPFRHFTDFFGKKQARSLRDFCREMGYNERRYSSGGYDAQR
mgnify:CR=1 FL=1